MTTESLSATIAKLNAEIDARQRALRHGSRCDTDAKLQSLEARREHLQATLRRLVKGA
jgi:hypothetical protein